MKRFLLIGLLLTVFLKQIIWTALVPVFQTPDEQAHFAQLQWYAEKKNLNIDGEKNLSLEAATAEEILGTRRDGQGNNKYTYHPEYKNNSQVPLMSKSSRTTYVDREAAMYPPLYYLTALPFYNAVYNSGLPDRLFASRLVSVIYGLLLVVVAYKIGKLVFESEFLALSLAVLVGFQPMVSYLAAGIHPDNLLNLLYSVAILVCLLILKNGLKIRYLVLLALDIYLGTETKVIIYLILPLVLAVSTYRVFKKNKIGVFLGFLILAAPAVASLFGWPIPFLPQPKQSDPLASMGLLEYMKFRLPKMAFEVWPWYWGVFKWLGVTLPRIVMQIITRVTGLAAVGVIIYSFQTLRSKKITFEIKSLIFCLLSLISYASYLILWDWRLMQTLGYSQGLQGRYFFPNIVPFMIILLFGWKTLFGKWQKFAVSILVLAMFVLNAVALQTVANSYY